MYPERTTLRGLTHIFDVSWNTVSIWLREDAEVRPLVEHTLQEAAIEEVLELDEL